MPESVFLNSKVSFKIHKKMLRINHHLANLFSGTKVEAPIGLIGDENQCEIVQLVNQKTGKLLDKNAND